MDPLDLLEEIVCTLLLLLFCNSFKGRGILDGGNCSSSFPANLRSCSFSRMEQLWISEGMKISESFFPSFFKLCLLAFLTIDANCSHYFIACPSCSLRLSTSFSSRLFADLKSSSYYYLFGLFLDVRSRSPNQ